MRRHASRSFADFWPAAAFLSHPRATQIASPPSRKLKYYIPAAAPSHHRRRGLDASKRKPPSVGLLVLGDGLCRGCRLGCRQRRPHRVEASRGPFLRPWRPPYSSSVRQGLRLLKRHSIRSPHPSGTGAPCEAPSARKQASQDSWLATALPPAFDAAASQRACSFFRRSFWTPLQR